MKLAFLVLSSILIQGCVKDESDIRKANSGGGTDPGSAVVTPDPLAAYAWHLGNTGQTSFSLTSGTSGEDIELAAAVGLGYKGKNVRIAISDSGVEMNHPDLAGNELSGEHRNYGLSSATLWRGADPHPSSGDPHGTAVAGLVSALGWNSIGSRGVAPESKFAAFRFILDYPATVTEASYLARYLDQFDGDFDIFNYSYGSASCSFDPEDPDANRALATGATELRNGKGAIYVQSAGNEYRFTDDCAGIYGNTNRSPDLGVPQKIVVGAVNALGKRSSYSTPGSSLWISAPGGEDGVNKPALITTDITTCAFGYSFRIAGLADFNWGVHSLNSTCSYTNHMNGTSGAAPIVSGVVALMLEANPNLTWRDVKHILASTADVIDYDEDDNVLRHPDFFELPTADYDYDLKWVKNKANYYFSNWYGFGRVNARKAVELARDYSLDLGTFEETVNPNTGAYYYKAEPLTLTIPDYDPDGVSTTLNVLHNFFIESVEVRLTTDHPAPGELAVHLISPRQTEGRLLTLNTYLDNVALDADYPLTSNAFYGEDSRGVWTLKVFDGSVANSGMLTGWKLIIKGHRILGPLTVPLAPTNLTGAATYGSSVTAPTVTFTASASPTVTRYEVSVGTLPSLTDKASWESIGLNTSFQVRNMRLTRGSTYYINVRAIDENERPSPLVYKSWTVQ